MAKVKKKNPFSIKKAKKILKDHDTLHGHTPDPAQKRLLGFIAGGGHYSPKKSLT